MAEQDFQKQQQQPTGSKEALLAHEAPGKDEQSAAWLSQTLRAMSDADLLDLLRAAYLEGPTANAVLIQEAELLLHKRGRAQEAEAVAQEVRSQDWRGVLGEFVGGELHGLLVNHTSAPKLQELGQQALQGMAKDLGPQVAKWKEGGPAVMGLATALGQRVSQCLQEFLQTPDGQSLLQAVGALVDNPHFAIQTALLAAAGAYLSNMDLPALKAAFQLGEGTLDASLDLGRLQSWGMDAVKLDLAYTSRGFGAKVSVAKDDEQSSISASVGQGRNSAELSAVLPKEGPAHAKLTSALGLGPVSAQGEVGYAPHNDKTQEGGLSSKLGADVALPQGAAHAELQHTGKQGLTSQVGAEVALGEGELAQAQLQTTEQSQDLRLQFQSQKDGLGLRSYTQVGTEGLLSGQALSFDAQALKLQAEVQERGHDRSLDAVSGKLHMQPHELVSLALSVGFQASGKSHLQGELKVEDDHWMASLSARANPSEGTLSKLQATLGFRDRDEMMSFFVQFSHTANPKSSIQELTILFEQQLGAFLVRADAHGSRKDGEIQDASLGLLAGVPLYGGLNLLLGGQAVTRQGEGPGWVPQVGLQLGPVGATVGWDTLSESVMFRAITPISW
jgi:hypothetical protein